MDLTIIKKQLLLVLIVSFLFAFFSLKPASAAYTLCAGPCTPWGGCTSPYVCVNPPNICMSACPASAYCRSGYPNCSCLAEYRDCPGYYCPCSPNPPAAPQTITIQTSDTYDLPNTTTVSWNYGSTSGCGNTWWGWICNGTVLTTNTNHFIIKVNDVVNQTLNSSARTTTIYLTSWGVNTIKVCAHNGSLETCATAADSPTLTQPTPYPTIVITGPLRQKSGVDESCPNISSPALVIEKFLLKPAFPQCITPACSGLPNNGAAKNFSCNVKFDNVGCQVAPNYLRPTPSQNFTLDAVFTGFVQPGQWADVSSASCQPVSLTIALNALTPGTINKAIVANFNEHWIKLKDAAFVTSTTATNTIPPVPIAFDSDDDATKKSFILGGSAGSSLGVDVGVYGTFTETNNWGSKTYVPQTQKFSPNVFVDYIKARKQFETITSLSGLDNNGIYYYDADLQIDDSNKNVFNGKKAVLVLGKNKTLTFKFDADGAFAPTDSASVMFIATNITLDSNVKSFNDTLLVSDNFNTGAGNNTLKINGNLDAQKSFTFSRDTGNNAKPSIFVYFKIKPYLDLLPYLSSSIYDWKQIQ